MAVASSTVNNQVAAMNQNANNRLVLLQTGLRESQPLPQQSFSSGQVLQFELNNAGILRYLMVTFQGTLTISGTGTATPSPKGPYNIFPKVEFVDYAGVTRINAEAFELHELTNLNKYGFDERQSPTTQPYASTVYNWPSTLSTGNTNVNFSFIVPIMYDENDPRGGIILTVPNGKCYLKLTCTNSLYGSTVDSVVQGSGYTVSLTGTITVTQYYFNPQAVKGQILLPMLDLAQIHEIISMVSTSNLAAGMDKLTTLPTGRVYHQVMQQFVNGSAGMDTVDIDRVTFLYDGNTPTLDEYLPAYLARTRRVYGRDLAAGIFMFDFRKKPWDSNVWGQLQTKLHIASGATVNSGAYLRTCMRSLYVANQNLGGLPQ